MGRCPTQAWIAVALLTGCAAEADRRDLVFIVVDTLRADYALDPEIDTPHLDELRELGVAFPRAYAHTSWTLPSHATIFSSRPPHATGVVGNRLPVPEDLPLLAPHLAARGYRTVAVHSLISLMPVEKGTGIDRGFEVFRQPLEGGHADGGKIHAELEPLLAELAREDDPFFLFIHYSDPHEPYRAHGTREVPARLHLNGEPVAEIQNLAEPETSFLEFALPPGVHRLDIDADAPFEVRQAAATAEDGTVIATEFHQSESGRLYAEVGHLGDEAVDVTLELWACDVPPPSEVRRRYALEVEYVDRWIGALLDSLRQHELLEDALLVFTSDHGEGLGDHGVLSHGVHVYDELLHVPLVIRPPAGHPAAGALEEAREELVRHIDLVPTVLDLLGEAALPGQQGTSLLTAAERLHEAEAHASWIEDRYAIFDGRWKLVHVPDRDAWRLYDLRSDPDETTDVLEARGHELDLDPWRERIHEMKSSYERRAPTAEPRLSPEMEAQMRAMGYAGGEAPGAAPEATPPDADPEG